MPPRRSTARLFRVATVDISTEFLDHLVVQRTVRILPGEDLNRVVVREGTVQQFGLLDENVGEREQGPDVGLCLVMATPGLSGNRVDTHLRSGEPQFGTIG